MHTHELMNAHHERVYRQSLIQEIVLADDLELDDSTLEAITELVAALEVALVKVGLHRCDRGAYYVLLEHLVRLASTTSAPGVEACPG